MSDVNRFHVSGPPHFEPHHTQKCKVCGGKPIWAVWIGELPRLGGAWPHNMQDSQWHDYCDQHLPEKWRTEAIAAVLGDTL